MLHNDRSDISKRLSSGAHGTTSVFDVGCRCVRCAESHGVAPGADRLPFNDPKNYVAKELRDMQDAEEGYINRYEYD